jgi:hypothetical protein
VPTQELSENAVLAFYFVLKRTKMFKNEQKSKERLRMGLQIRGVLKIQLVCFATSFLFRPTRSAWQAKGNCKGISRSSRKLGVKTIKKCQTFKKSKIVSNIN